MDEDVFLEQKARWMLRRKGVEIKEEHYGWRKRNVMIDRGVQREEVR